MTLRRSVVAFCGLAFAGLALLCFLPLWCFERNVARLRSAGDPVAASDLRPAPVPTGENGAADFVRAYSWYRTSQGQPGARDCTRVPREEWTDQHWREAAEYVQACEPFVDCLRRGAAARHYALDVSWQDGPDVVIVTIPLAQMAADVLTCKALLATRNGDTARAVEALALLLDVADRQERYCLLSFRVNLTVYVMVARTIKMLARDPAFDARVADDILGPRLGAIEDQHTFADALRGERVIGLLVLDNRMTANADGFMGKRRIWVDGCDLLDAMHELVVLAYEDYARAGSRASAIIDSAARSGSVVTRLAIPKCGEVFEERARAVGVARAARLALEILKYKNTIGDWPKELGQLPVLPDEPLSGEPFRYTRLPDGARLSLGHQRAAAGYDEDCAWEFR